MKLGYSLDRDPKYFIWVPEAICIESDRVTLHMTEKTAHLIDSWKNGITVAVSHDGSGYMGRVDYVYKSVQVLGPRDTVEINVELGDIEDVRELTIPIMAQIEDVEELEHKIENLICAESESRKQARRYKKRMKFFKRMAKDNGLW